MPGAALLTLGPTGCAELLDAVQHVAFEQVQQTVVGEVGGAIGSPPVDLCQLFALEQRGRPDDRRQVGELDDPGGVDVGAVRHDRKPGRHCFELADERGGQTVVELEEECRRDTDCCGHVISRRGGEGGECSAHELVIAVGELLERRDRLGGVARGPAAVRLVGLVAGVWFERM